MRSGNWRGSHLRVFRENAADIGSMRGTPVLAASAAEGQWSKVYSGRYAEIKTFGVD
jgi:hypothetical protein